MGAPVCRLEHQAQPALLGQPANFAVGGSKTQALHDLDHGLAKVWYGRYVLHRAEAPLGKVRDELGTGVHRGVNTVQGGGHLGGEQFLQVHWVQRAVRDPLRHDGELAVLPI